jgi:uncharacterized protein
VSRPDRDDEEGVRASRAPRHRRPAPAPDRAGLGGAYLWDERKNQQNQGKHSIAFEAATRVFEDPLHVTAPIDTAGEPQWQTVGMASPGLMLLVVHTLGAPDSEGGAARIRILSARVVTKSERQLFETSKAKRSTQVLGHAATPEDRGWFGPGGLRQRALVKRTSSKG